jgi:hypothetical protein
MKNGNQDIDLLGMSVDAPTLDNSQLGIQGKDFRIEPDGTRIEKPFSGENTLDEPVMTTVVQSGLKQG